jgi:hypothetical protein
VDKTYRVHWSQSALDELTGILAYPPEVKERIFQDSFARLSYTPTLTANNNRLVERLLGKIGTLSSYSCV